MNWLERFVVCFIGLVIVFISVCHATVPGCDTPGVLWVPCTSNTTCIGGCYSKFYPPGSFEECIQGTGYCAATPSNPSGVNKFCALQSSGQLEGWYQVECG